MAKLPFLSQVTKHTSHLKVNISFILSSFSLSESVGRLYDNYEGLLDQFALFWGEVARTFAGSKTWNLLDCPIDGCISTLQMSTFWVTRSWTSLGAATSTRIQHSLSQAWQTGDIFSPCMLLSCNFILQSPCLPFQMFEHVSPPP